MKRPMLLSLLIGVSTLTAVGIYVSNDNQAKQQVLGNVLSLSSSPLDFEQLTRVDVYEANEVRVASAKKALQEWQLPNQHNYWAETRVLANLLSAIKNSQIVEAKTKLAKNHNRLGLTDINEPDSQAKLLKLHFGQQTFSLLVGKVAQMGSGQFVRLEGQDQTYLINQTIGLPESEAQWLRTDAIDLEYNAVRSLSLSLENEELIAIQREPKNKTVADLPGLPTEQTEEASMDSHFAFLPEEANQELAYPGILDGLVKNLLALKVTAVETQGSQQVEDELAHIELSVETSKQYLQIRHFKVVSLVGETGQFIGEVQGQYWLGISDFEFKQISQPKSEFLAQDSDAE